MERQHGSTPAGTRAELSDSTRLAVDRTRLAYERTLMAWVRTSVSLISFGFTAYKFLQYVRESSKGSHPERIFGARDFALLMIVMGLLSMVVATAGSSVAPRPLWTRAALFPRRRPRRARECVRIPRARRGDVRAVARPLRQSGASG